MTYSNDYRRIFASSRNLLNDELENYCDYLSMCKSIGHHCTWAYISIVANSLTAYNELSNLSFFVKTTHFKRNN